MTMTNRSAVDDHHDALRRVYVARGLVSNDGIAASISRCCEHAATCWNEHESRRPSPGAKADELSAPWIGEHYDRGRTVVLLGNLHEYGGWDVSQSAQTGMRFLANAARAGFKSNNRRLFRGVDDSGRMYRGTDVWTQAISYASAWLAVDGILANVWDSQRRISCASLADAIGLVAIVQHVKCSPTGDRSRPSDAMWVACGEHLLKHELAILQPERIVVLGADRNLTATRPLLGRLRSLGSATIKNKKTTMNVRLESGDGYRVLAVPHPSAWGGVSKELLAAADALLRDVAATQPAE